MQLYPLKFNPIYSYRIWGGDKLKTFLHKEYTDESIGESWEISDIENNETLVSNGALEGKSLKDVIKVFKGDFLGKKVYNSFGNKFPLLIKFIDANKPLSIQVHPSNELAKQRHNSFGKNEMWYVMEAEKNAELIVGFNQKINQKRYLEYLENSTILEILNTEKVQKGDTYYIPTGRVHAIGAGVLLAEIQQTSNITYRIYDYNRIDAKTGQKRELHNDLAIDAINFNYYKDYKTQYSNKENISNSLVHSPYFKTNFIHITSKNIEKNYTDTDSFVIYMCVEGNASVSCNSKTYSLKIGETLLIPAMINKLTITSNSAKILEVYL